MLKRFAALAAACLLSCAPALAQDVRTLPQAAPLTGAEKMPAVQGSGCATKVTPCAAVAVTPSLISTFLTPTFQPKDADLDAIAALTTVDFGRQLLTKASAASVRTYLGAASAGANVDITSITGSAATLTTGRTLAITGDLSWTSPSFNGSGSVTATGTLAIVNGNVGTFGAARQVPVLTVNAKGLVTAATTATPTVLYATKRRTSGTVTVPSGSAMSDFSTDTDITIAAVAGDLVSIGINAQAGDGNAGTIEWDVVTLVGGSQVTSVSGGQIGSWSIRAGQYFGLSGSIRYVVQAADVASGLVVFRLRARTDGAAARSVFAIAGVPFVWDVTNLGRASN